MVIHVVIALAAGYSVGSEFRRRSMRAWLACAGGNPIVALAGKLAPLFAIFFLIMLAVPLILEGLFGIRFRGDVPMIVAAGVAADHCLSGARRPAAASGARPGDRAWAHRPHRLAGIRLCRRRISRSLGMNAFAPAWSAILPLRWYMAVLLGQAARGLPVHDSAAPFAVLAALAVLYALLAFLRLRASRGALSREAPRPAPVPPAAAPRGVGGAFAAEWRRVLGMRGAFILLVVAPLIYGIYYPQPYLGQILRKIPIAVVDNDLSELSRRIVADAGCERRGQRGGRAPTRLPRRTPRSTAARPSPWSASRPAPSATCSRASRLTFRSTPMPPTCSSSGSTASGIAVAINTLSSELAAGGARTDGSLVKATLAAASPADILLQPIFNPVGGYASYIVPAAFVLILQQTLLIGAAMLTGVGAGAGGRRRIRRACSAAASPT